VRVFREFNTPGTLARERLFKVLLLITIAATVIVSIRRSTEQNTARRFAIESIVRGRQAILWAAGARKPGGLTQAEIRAFAQCSRYILYQGELAKRLVNLPADTMTADVPKWNAMCPKRDLLVGSINADAFEDSLTNGNPENAKP